MISNQAAYGRAIAGYDVAILHIGSKYALFPGNVQHAATFPFPVLYKQVELEKLEDLFNGADYVGDRLLAASQSAIAGGVKAIVGACGSFGYFHKQVAEQTSVPTFLSILTQVPFLQAGLVGQKLGVICASKDSMNARMYEACGIEKPNQLVIAEMRGRPEFDRFLGEEELIDFKRMEAETLEAAGEIFASGQQVGAILLQCSDLPPFAPALKMKFDVPVFHAGTLVNHLVRAAA